MDKDFEGEVPKSDDSADEHAEDRQIARAIELADQLSAQQRRLKKSVAKLKQELEINSKTLAYLQEEAKQRKLSELQPSLSESPGSSRSTLNQSQNVSEKSSKNKPDSAISVGNLNQLEGIACVLAEALRNQSTVLSDMRKSFEPLLKTDKNIPIKDFPSEITPPKSPEDGTQVDGSTDDGSDTDSEISDENVGSGGKGKEAENPYFRYKKRSKTDVASQDASAKESPTKSAKEPYLPSHSEYVDLKSPKPGPSGISLVANRKDNKRNLEDNSAKTSGCSKSSENPSGDDGDAVVPKRRKTEDTEKPSEQCPSLTSILSNTNFERLELVSFMDPYQAARFYQSDESAPASGSDGVVPSGSASDVSPSEKDESSLPSASEDENGKS